MMFAAVLKNRTQTWFPKLHSTPAKESTLSWKSVITIRYLFSTTCRPLGKVLLRGSSQVRGWVKWHSPNQGSSGSSNRLMPTPGPDLSLFRDHLRVSRIGKLLLSPFPFLSVQGSFEPPNNHRFHFPPIRTPCSSPLGPGELVNVIGDEATLHARQRHTEPALRRVHGHVS